MRRTSVEVFQRDKFSCVNQTIENDEASFRSTTSAANVVASDGTVALDLVVHFNSISLWPGISTSHCWPLFQAEVEKEFTIIRFVSSLAFVQRSVESAESWPTYCYCEKSNVYTSIVANNIFSKKKSAMPNTYIKSKKKT